MGSDDAILMITGGGLFLGGLVVCFPELDMADRVFCLVGVAVIVGLASFLVWMD